MGNGVNFKDLCIDLRGQLDRVTAERDAALGREKECQRQLGERWKDIEALRNEAGQVKGEYDRAVNKIDALQQRLNKEQGLYNQTIDGVPRELLDSFVVYVADSPNAIMRAKAKELRALLDAPAPQLHKFSGVMIGGVIYARECRGCGLTYIAGEIEIDESKMGKCIQEHGSPVPSNDPGCGNTSGSSDCDGGLSKPAAQHQGEPVAWLYTRPEQREGAQRVPDVLLRERANPEDVVGWKEQALYAEHPAPVAAPLDYGSLDPVQRLAVCRGEQVAVEQKYDDTLLPFVAMMRRELHANDGKGDRPGWLSITTDTCLLEIICHFGKLQASVKRGDEDGIREYAADVANMCMMLSDICNLLETK